MDKNIKKQPIEKIAPKVSVQIITKNRAKLLPLAIESALNQTYKNLEIIIIDNNSTDKTEELVKRYISMDTRIKYFRVVESWDITKTRNYAISKSAGKYIAILDSDDFWLSEEKIEKQVNFLQKNTDYAVIGTNHIFVDIHNKEIQIKKHLGEYKKTDEEIKERLLIKNQLLHSSTLINKQVLQEVGGYDERYSIWEDYALFLKIGREYKIANLPDIMTAYRKHSDNVSSLNKIKNLVVLAHIIFENRAFYPKAFTSLCLVAIRIVAALFKKY